MQVNNSYIICSLPRSGSTLLAAALAKTGLAGNPQEFFKEDSLAVWKGRLDLGPDTSLEKSVTEVVETTRSDNGLFGQKVMWNHLEKLVVDLGAKAANFNDLPTHELVKVFFPEAKMIFIRREDKLKQAISFLKAMQLEVWHQFTGTEIEEDGLRFDYREINVLMQNMEEQERQWRELFEKGNFNYYETTYETLIADYENTITRILEFLGLGTVEIPSADELGFIPTRSKINSRWEKEYIEVDEKVREFDQSNIRKELPDSGFHASITTDQEEWRVCDYQQFAVNINVENTSDCLWRSVGSGKFRYWIRLKCEWKDESGNSVKTNWANLDADCHPGETAAFSLLQHAPEKIGDYTIEIDLVQDGVASFSEKGNERLIIPVTVALSEWQSRIEDYFGEYRQLSRNYIHVPWFGALEISKFPAVYHRAHGWLYCDDQGAATDSFWFKTEGMGYLWTSKEKYPLMYSDERKAWLEYLSDTHDPPKYRDPETGVSHAGIRSKFES